MRVWVDITDASAVVFFAPVVRRLEEAGHTVTLTARRFAGADLVLRRYGLGGVLLPFPGIKIIDIAVNLFHLA